VFGIEFLNEFEGKNMVGNIIPAICSSNSIVAGIQTSETLKLLYKNFVFDQMKAKLGSSTKNSQKTDAKSAEDKPESTPDDPNATVELDPETKRKFRVMPTRECYIQNNGSERIKPIKPMTKNDECMVCTLSKPIILELNFQSLTLANFFDWLS
jgi:hypothetical protein